MKLLTRSICALLFMAFSLSLNASVEPTVSIKGQKGQSFSLHLKDMENETFDIQLIDKNNLVLLNEKVVDQNDYLKLFNLKNLPAGDYKLKIEDNRKIIFQDINISKGRLIIDPATKRELLKPMIQHQSSYFDLNMVSDEDQIINVNIRDENREVVYQKKIKEVGSINKRFNLMALSAGNYMVEVITYDYTYQQEFTIGSDHMLNFKTLDKSQKKEIKENEAAIDTNKDNYPYVTEDVKNRIKWLQSLRN